MTARDPAEDAHLARRQIPLVGWIDGDRAQRVIAQMLYLRHMDGRAPMTLLVDSPGGAVVEGLAILDTMDWLGPTAVRTHCCGEAHAIAALILAHGRPGERTAVPEAVLSISLPWAAPGQDVEPEVQERELERLTQVVLEFTARGTGRSAEDLRADLAAERRFTAAEAVGFGLIDRIVTSPETSGWRAWVGRFWGR